MIGPEVIRSLVGGYTDATGSNGGPPQGVVPLVHDRRAGTLRQDGPALPLPNPSYLIRHPRAPLVYAVHETDPGAVTALAVDGPVRVLATLATPGAHPCHLCLSADLRYLLLANYGDGSVVAVRLDRSGLPIETTAKVDFSGSGPHERQAAPHAHQVATGPDGTLWVVDLGADLVRRLDLGHGGTLTELEPAVVLPPGTGPRQIRVRPDHRTGYVLGELSGELITVSLTGSGAVLHRQPCWLTQPGRDYLPAHLSLTTTGRLYASLRGADRVTVFDTAGGSPRPIGEAATLAWPRHFALDGRWLYLAEQLADRVTICRLNDTGLAPTDIDRVSHPVHQPSCVLLLPFRRHRRQG
jgi:6-phosphogluconolactonase